MASIPPPERTIVNPRPRLLRVLRRHFQNRRPRLVMTGILLLTWAIGFLVSYTLLHCGFARMWLRYPVAVIVAWGAFLGLIRAWAQLESRTYRFDETSLDTAAAGDLSEVPHSRSGGGLEKSPFDLLDLTDLDLDVGEGCFIALGSILFFGLVVFTVGALISVITAAPYLMSEVFLDAVFVAALYKRLNRLDRRSWLESALRHTLGPVLSTAALLVALGVVFHVMAPEAKSIRGVWHHYVHNRPASEIEVEAADAPH